MLRVERLTKTYQTGGGRDLTATELVSPQELVLRAGLASEDARRDAYVRAHARGTFFHLSGWRRVVERGDNATAHLVTTRDAP